MTDIINHPTHYTSHASRVECIEICEQMSFNAGAAFKYLFRRNLKHKDDQTVDLRKALWYVEREGQAANGGIYISVSELPEPLIGDFEGDFFERQDAWITTDGADLPDMTRRVVAHEPSFIAGAMAYLVRGWMNYDGADFAIAAHYIERELARIEHE